MKLEGSVSAFTNEMLQRLITSQFLKVTSLRLKFNYLILPTLDSASFSAWHYEIIYPLVLSPLLSHKSKHFRDRFRFQFISPKAFSCIKHCYFAPTSLYLTSKLWGQAVYPLWWPSLTKDKQTEQFLCWSGMTVTEHTHLVQTK